jgi:Protein of unknown function (DUF3768)
MGTTQTKAERIRELNDRLRTTFTGGRVFTTDGVAALPDTMKVDILQRVRTFDQFDADNDPHREHDFGSFEIAGEQFFFKIDYYNRNLDGGSEDPADPDATTRVLTIMLASEY